MVVKIGVMQLKRDASPQHFHLCNDKGDLKDFQINFETLFLQVSVTICHLPIWEGVREEKTHVHFWKTAKLVWQGLSRQCFLKKQSVIERKVLFTLIDDYFMYEDLPLFIE